MLGRRRRIFSRARFPQSPCCASADRRGVVSFATSERAAFVGSAGDAPRFPPDPHRANPMSRAFFLLALALPMPVLAQNAPAANPAVAAIRSQWEAQSGYILRAAEQMPEADYSFKPVATVRS